MINYRCVCEFQFTEFDKEKEPDKYCSQCGRNQFKGQSPAWKIWAKQRGITNF